MKEDNNFTEWYQERFKQLNEQPPKDVWNNISRELDINDTWKGVDLKLNFIARRKTIIRRTSSALVLLLLLFISGGMVRYLLNDSEKKINLAVENVNTLEINDNSFLPEEKKEINFTKPEKDAISGNSVESKQTTKSLSSKKHVSVKRKTTKENTIVYSTDSEQTAKSLSSLEEANGNAVVYSTESIQTVKSLSSLEEVNVKSKEANGSTEVYSTENIQTAKSLSSLEEANGSTEVYSTESIQTAKSLSSQEEANGNAVVYNTKNNPSPLNSNFKTITDNQQPIATQANAVTNAEAEELLAIPVGVAFINVRETDSINPLVLNYCPNYLSHTFNNGFQGWNIGAFYSINNTWIINNQTLNIIESTSLNELELNFGNAYGLTAAYNFNTHVSGEFNWAVNSKQGQTSHFYYEGRYQTNAIKLNYTVFNLSLKHRKEGRSKYFNAPKSINFVAGINVGVLKYGTDAIESSKIKSQYSKTDYGLRIGYEYEILAFKKIVFSSAILANIGLNNIYKESANKPTSYKVGHNALLGFQLGAKYILK